jgi:hypothetical protein
MASDSQILGVIEYVFARMPSNTNDRCTALCNEVCHQLRATGYELGAGLVAKSAGQEHGTGADGQLYAVDAIWIEVPGRAADILISAPTASQPWLGWYSGEQLPPTASYRTPYGARLLPVYGSEVPPDPPDPVCRFTPTDLSDVIWRLDEVLAKFDRLEQQHLAIVAEVRSGGWPVKVSNRLLSLSGSIGPKVDR